ncbi:MAG: LON peptidase substrate-binding domain-containing protein [Acidobacteria bacterium]|nr:LON peptidase substrate-binding domain-containing protein [Acidobacteriota bacterium]
MLIPLFPLPNVVLFPSVFLPLHIFESRYRQMLTDALRADRMIGMVLIKERQSELVEVPEVYPIGCAGVISHSQTLPDGRSNIVLRGMQRFRIGWEEHDRDYRRAYVEPLVEPLTDPIRLDVRTARSKLEMLLGGRLATADGEVIVPADMPDEDLINTLSQYLDLEPVEKQALLERDDVAQRSQALIELIEMRTLTPGQRGGLGLQ